MKTDAFQAIVALGIAAFALVLPAPPAGAQEKPAPEKAAEQIPTEEKPFWDSAQAFVDAYAKRDSAAIGMLFTKDAEFYDEFGELTEGRDAIAAMFQDVFDSAADALIDEIRIERVRHITDDVALEEGIVVSSEAADSPHFQSRYVALHTKGEDGKWRINTLKDYPRENVSRRDQLQQLAWLVGEWVNEDPNTVVHTKCDWSADGNYLLREFTVQTQDDREMNGRQRIGWDPALKKLRSWTFDSEGGFFNGLWTKDKNRWLLTSAGVSANGATVTATSVYTPVDNEMITWQYRSLIVGGDVRTASEPVTMVKRPPAPQQASE
jgi:uncharacterized protein (TIGR02246 family)